MRHHPPRPAVSDRVRVRRLHEHGRYDRSTINAVLDESFLCHIGFLYQGYPIVLPTLYWRDRGRLYWHGSTAGRMLRTVDGTRVCIAVTCFDGLVLARSAYNHTANYRSVTLFGTASRTVDTHEKLAQLKRMMDLMLPRRWAKLRPATESELKATCVMSIAIEEASAKVRMGPPGDTEEADWPVWAGVIPFSSTPSAPERCDTTADDDVPSVRGSPKLS